MNIDPNGIHNQVNATLKEIHARDDEKLTKECHDAALRYARAFAAKFLNETEKVPSAERSKRWNDLTNGIRYIVKMTFEPEEHSFAIVSMAEEAAKLDDWKELSPIVSTAAEESADNAFQVAIAGGFALSECRKAAIDYARLSIRKSFMERTGESLGDDDDDAGANTGTPTKAPESAQQPKNKTAKDKEPAAK